VIISEEDHLAHYGILRRSGRYPWGSGGDESESARNRSLLQTLKDLQAQGMSQTEIARGWDMTTTDLRAHKTQAIDQQRHEKQLRAFTLREKGLSNQKIAETMGLPNESSVRSLLSRFEKDEKSALQTTADMIKAHVDEKKYVDVGKGVEYQLGITENRLKTAVAMLRNEGYELHTIHIETGPYRFTAMKVLARPGTALNFFYMYRSQI
jgi:transcriptional regulator